MKYISATLLFCFGLLGFAQEQIKGNVITSFGDVYRIDDIDVKIDTCQAYKAVFDVGKTYDNPNQLNPLFNTAARYLNMHEMAGIPLNKLSVALVVHGSASQDLLNDEAYTAKFGFANPNTPLLKALHEQGVQIIMCGQTAAHRGLSKNQLLTEVSMALSAMTALVQLQNENFRLINF